MEILTKRRRGLLGLPIEKVKIKKGGRDWLRELIRMRDGHTCQKCFKKWKEGRRRFDVHHLEESMFGKTLSREASKYDRENMDKLITFCHKCHFKWHSENGRKLHK